MPEQNSQVVISERDKNALRKDLKIALKKQGFVVHKGKRLDIKNKDKNDLRKIQLAAKNQILYDRKAFIRSKAPLIRQHLISGRDLDPTQIQLEIRQIQSGTQEELLFRWWNLVWWSMPYQRPYGRQMRFIIWDVTHDAPFGLISLQSPILKQAVRDKGLHIPKDKLDYWVNRSMYAQRVGALPPYNYLIGGKMVALSLVSNEIKQAYQQKYQNSITLIDERMIDSDLLFITTTSAFGRSSIYNRLKYNDDMIAEKLGYTEGYGSFQIPDDLYERLIMLLEASGDNTERGYGNGPSRKLKLINLACRRLGLANYSYHGIKREYFSFPLVHNLRQVISQQEKPDWKNYSFNDLANYWHERWLVNRAERNDQWRTYDGNVYLDNILASLQEKDMDNG